MALSAYIGLLALVGAERIAELLLSRRNARIAFSRGGVEAGAAHFRWMALVHALFLPACAVEAILREHDLVPRVHAIRRGHDVFIVSPDLYQAAPALVLAALALVVAAQALRWWAIASLGWRWNVRIIAVPDAPPVRSGPYRFVRHPNYIAVAVEMLFIPLAQGAWICALTFSALNALLLRVRIRDEERALGAPYQRAFAQVPRFIPHG
jgi:methyltransferase